MPEKPYQTEAQRVLAERNAQKSGESAAPKGVALPPATIEEIKNKTLTAVEHELAEFEQQHSLSFPKNYSPGNALKSAWLYLQKMTVKDPDDNWTLKPVLTFCTPESIKTAMLDMVIQGLSIAKNQGNMISYKKELKFQRNYFGTLAVVNRLENTDYATTEVVFEGDQFEYIIENGVKRISKHIQILENITSDPEKIRAAYCIINKKDGTPPHVEIMTKQQVYDAWKKSTNKPFGSDGSLKKDSTHYQYGDQMFKKTVIQRAAKYFVNTSDDSDLLVETFNRTTEDEFEKVEDKTVMDIVHEEVKEKANLTPVDFRTDAIDADAIQVTDEEEKSVTEESKAEESHPKLPSAFDL